MYVKYESTSNIEKARNKRLKEYEKAKKQAEKAQQKVAKDIEERKKRTEK